MKKTHYKKLMNPNYLGSWDVPEGKTLQVKIARVDKELVTNPETHEKEECVVATLDGYKPMILNVTNCKTIKKIFQSPYIEDWKDKTIEIRVEKVRAFGEIWDALRVVPQKVDTREELTPDSKRWSGAIEALQNGKCDMEYIKKNFKITPKNIKLLEESC